ncbi:MAG TPA: DNA polymerase III subunit beta [Mycobacteriales bacterium]|nr:DNA polymerase III subunit beta [Mycobacteriales bacterium]
MAEALTFASIASPRHAAMPFLKAVLVTGHPDAAELTGFDYERATSAHIDGSGVGHAAVDRPRLHNLLRSLDSTAEVRLDADDARLTVRCGNVVATLPLAESDFPAIPANDDIPVAALGEQPLAALRRVAIGAGTDDTLPLLTAIEFSVDGGELVAATTDRYRLAVYRTGIHADLSEPMLVPAKPLDDVLKVTTARKHVDRGAPATLGQVEQDDVRWATLSSLGYRTTLRTIDGEFPKWRTLLPTEFAARARVNTRSLRDAITKLKVAVDAGGTSRHTGRSQPTRPMILDLADGDCRASAGSEQDCQVAVPLDIAYEGEPMSVAFTPAYLLDGTAVLNSEEFDLNLVGPAKPALLTSPTDPAMSYLLMTVRLAG